MGRRPEPDAQIMLCMSFAETQAINAKVGEAWAALYSSARNSMNTATAASA